MHIIKRVFGLKKLLIMRSILWINSSLLIITSCSVQQKISRSARQLVLKDSSLLTAHVGISIYDPAADKYWYNYNGEKYFVPASNTKIPTCYAAMKYLGDSLVGLKYALVDGAYLIEATGDPTFLHPNFKVHRAFDFIKNKVDSLRNVDMVSTNWESKPWGSGWSWNDYLEPYMAERSPFPIYGNIAHFKLVGQNIKSNSKFFDIKWNDLFRFTDSFSITRGLNDNEFDVNYARNKFTEDQIPFKTFGYHVAIDLIDDTLNSKPGVREAPFTYLPNNFKTIHSQPTDSLLKPMMHRSDNFFAEQSLLMVSNEMLGVMNDEKIIDTLLKTDFKDLPQKPRWADGSGLSRYNLFSPQDFIFILNKMKNEFGMERIKIILPTGGTGTISSYYKADSNYIFAKTGTLGGVVALSGYIYTKKGKLLIFSTLINNHQATSAAVRRAVEKFIQGIRNKY